MFKRLLIFAALLLFNFNCLIADNHATFSKIWDEVKAVEKQNKFKEAEQAYLSLIEKTQASKNMYWEFYAHSGLSWLYYEHKSYRKRAEQLELALECLDYLLKNDHRKFRWQFEQILNMGYLEKSYTTQYELTKGLNLHRKLIKKLNAFVGAYEGKTFDVLDAQVAVRIPAKFRSLVPRTIWREAFYLSKQGKVYQAVDLLEKFIKKTKTKVVSGTFVEQDYHLKLLNELGGYYKFLGYAERGINCQTEALKRSFIQKHQRTKNIAQFNDIYYRTQHFGPKDEYIKQAYDLYKNLCELSPTKESLSSKKQLFKILSLIDTTQAKTEMMQEVIEATKFQGDIHGMQYSRRDLAIERMKRGDMDGLEQEFLDLLYECRKQSNKVGEPTLYCEYALFLEKSNRFDEAIKVMQNAVDMTESFGWYIHLPRLYRHQSRFYLAVNKYSEAKKCWDKIDEIMAKYNDFPDDRKLEVLVYKLEYLIAVGDVNGALKQLRLAEKFAKESNLNAFQKELLTQTNWNNEIDKVDNAIEEEKVIQSVAIYPASVRTVVANEENLFTTFTLANNSYEQVQGELVIKGAKAEVEKFDGEVGYLSVKITELSGETKYELSLLGEAHLPIIVSYDDSVEEKAEVYLQWESESSEALNAYWLIEHDSEPGDLAITNSNLTWSNPYLSIPLYHNIVNRTEDVVITDFAVKSTIPCRVELYDASTGELLGIDNRADSNFESQEDVLIVDQNSSNYPDMEIGSIGTLLLQVFPIEEANEDIEEFTLDLKLKIGAEWIGTAQDRIILNKSDSNGE